MHEFSIACSLVEQVEQAAAQAGLTEVRAVHIRIGPLSGIAIDALENCWELATANTALFQTQLECEATQVRIYCSNCQRVVESLHEWQLNCPHCGEYSADLRSGRELDLVSLVGP